MIPEPFPQLSAFRDQVYRHLHRRSDTLFEMLDALLALPTATAPAHLMLLPGFQRRWGSIYDALSAGQIDVAGMQVLLAQSPFEGGAAVYAVDASTWVRNDAETSPKRAYYHHHSRHSAGKPIVAGWSYQWLAEAELCARQLECARVGSTAGTERQYAGSGSPPDSCPADPSH